MRDVSLTNFAGGYHTNTPSTALRPNELLQAENCYFDDMLRCRKGREVHASIAGTTIRGIIRTDITGSPQFVVAADDGSQTSIYTGNTTFSAVSGASLSAGADCRMDVFGNRVIVVNGVDAPIAVTYEGGSWSVATIDSLDTRERDSTFCYAGRHDGTSYTDDSNDIFDVGDVVFSGTSGHGLFVACDYIFNRVSFSITAQVGPYTATYEYWDGEQWTAFTPDTAPDWGSSGSQTLEWSPFFNSSGDPLWFPYNAADAPLAGRYAIRIVFDSGGELTASITSVSHTKYLSEIMANEKPSDVCVHNNRICFASHNTVNLSPYNKISDWNMADVEYFAEGGSEITRLLSTPLGLLVFKPGAIYLLSGNSYQNWKKEKLSDIGTSSPNSVVLAEDEVYYLADDGIRGYNGTMNRLLSKHIASDVTAATNVSAIFWNDTVYMLFPDDEVVFRFNPDTYRQDDDGDHRVSFFKYVNQTFSKLFAFDVFGDLDLPGAYYGPSIYKIETGNTDEGTQITMNMQTPYLRFSSGGSRKLIGRVKFELTRSCNYTLTAHADEGRDSASTSFSSDDDDRIHVEELTLPYYLDGKSISFSLSGVSFDGSHLPGVLASHLAYEKRGY